MVAESGAYYLLTYYSPSPPNDGKRHRIKVTTRRTEVNVRAREEYVSPAKAPKASSTPAPLDGLLNAPIQGRGLTMRIVAIPAPLGNAPSATVIVGIELPSAAAGRAGRVDFSVAAIDEEGKTRARLRFNTNFTPPAATTPAWTHTGSRIDIAPGRYQIRVAAVGADKTQGSVFTELDVPKFDADLAVGAWRLAPRCRVRRETATVFAASSRWCRLRHSKSHPVRRSRPNCRSASRRRRHPARWSSWRRWCGRTVRPLSSTA